MTRPGATATSLRSASTTFIANKLTRVYSTKPPSSKGSSRRNCASEQDRVRHGEGFSQAKQSMHTRAEINDSFSIKEEGSIADDESASDQSDRGGGT